MEVNFLCPKIRLVESTRYTEATIHYFLLLFCVLQEPSSVFGSLSPFVSSIRHEGCHLLRSLFVFRQAASVWHMEASHNTILPNFKRMDFEMSHSKSLYCAPYTHILGPQPVV